MKPVDVNSSLNAENNNKGSKFDAYDDIRISRQTSFFSKGYTSSGLKKMLYNNSELKMLSYQ